MIRFKDYIWQGIRQGMLISWIIFFSIAIIAYTGTVTFQKNKYLSASLQVAASTIRESMEAGDWSLTLGHLMALEKYGPVFNIKLSGNNNQFNLTGPFGIKPFGIGSLCKKNSVAVGTELHACMVLFGVEELITLSLFILLSCGLSFLVFTLLNQKFLGFIDKVSIELKKMHNLDISTTVDSKEEIVEIVAIRDYIIFLLKEAKIASKAIAISQLSTQVAHDIRSPLVALDMAIKHANLPEKKKLLIHNAICRIHDIANNLLQHYRSYNSNDKLNHAGVEIESFLANMLDVIVSEKHLQYQHHSIFFNLIIEQDAHTLFSKINHIEFKRMISNLINNAVEAISYQGNVTISLSKEQQFALIKIIDNGHGIPSDILLKICDASNNKEINLGKKNSHGLGLSHAFSMVKTWNGHINIISTLKKGTTINIKLPITAPPTWLASDIKIKFAQTIVIFDDDPSIHEIWIEKFNNLTSKQEITILHFSSYNELCHWGHQEKERLSQYLFLVDYEITGTNKTGIDLINNLHIQSNTILVTSRYEEIEVIKQCKALGISILTKPLIPYVAIQLISPKYYDAVLIDDDTLVQQVWENVANEQQKHIETFTTITQFLLKADKIDKKSIIYIDSNLGDNVKGEIIAKKIFELGFKQIVLTSGMPAYHFGNLPYIKEIISKSPPW